MLKFDYTNHLIRTYKQQVVSSLKSTSNMILKITKETKATTAKILELDVIWKYIRIRPELRNCLIQTVLLNQLVK